MIIQRAILFIFSILLFQDVAGSGWSDMLRDKALQKKGLIDVTAENFPEIIKTDRDSWLVLLFTSYPPSIACPFCVEFRPIYNILVQNWLRQYKGRNGAPFFFSTIEFKNGDSVFQEMGVEKIPYVVAFPPSKTTKDSLKSVSYDWTKQGRSAEAMASWINSLTNGDFVIVSQQESGSFISPLVQISVALIIATVFRKKLTKLLQQKSVWFLICVAITLVMNSGFMFTRIRHIPFTAQSDDGRVSWLAGSPQYQFGAEGYVVALLYAVLASLTGLLTFRAPILSDPKKQRFAIIIWTAVQVVVFGYLITILRTKLPQYPYKFIF